MDANKLITEFQNISSKLNSYELERNNLQSKIKLLEKENIKLNDKVKKEVDPLLKSLYKSKIVANTYFIDEINSIFSFYTKKSLKEKQV